MRFFELLQQWFVTILLGLILIIVGILAFDSLRPAPASSAPATDINSTQIDIPDASDVLPPTATPLPTETPIPNFFIHTVASGDSLYALSLQYGVSIEEIEAANTLLNPDRLEIGQEIIIPTAPQ